MNAPMKPLAIIGGTGGDELEGLEVVRERPVVTPYGEPSRPIQEGRLGNMPVFFLQRHGSPGAIPPHLINYRANLWALPSLGVGSWVSVPVPNLDPGLPGGRKAQGHLHLWQEGGTPPISSSQAI